MRATEELAKRQRENPLGPAGDRVVRLFAGLPKLSDPKFEKVRVSTNLAVGEINLRQPNAKTFHYPDQSHLITIYSGLIDFYVSVSRIIMGATNLYTNEGVFKACSMGDCISNLEALFRRWTPQGLEEHQPSELEQTELPGMKAADADLLLTGALRFVLCHELGHVLYYGTKHRKTDAAGLTEEQEFASDIVGMKTTVTSAGSGPYSRVNLAGCVLSLRVLDVFAVMGHSFTGDHPAPLSRLNNVFTTVRTWCSSPIDYWLLTPIAYAYDELLETAGQRAMGGPDLVPVRADRAFSRVSAAMEEVLKGEQEEASIVPLMEKEFAESSQQVLEEISAYAAEVFAENSAPPQFDAEGWSARGALFRSLYHQWPKRVSDVFDAAFERQKQIGA